MECGNVLVSEGDGRSAALINTLNDEACCDGGCARWDGGDREGDWGRRTRFVLRDHGNRSRAERRRWCTGKHPRRRVETDTCTADTR